MPQTLAEIRALLERHGLRPKHALGQNFLIDHNLIDKLVRTADLTPGDLVLEIGPGTGTLTEALIQAHTTVIACELDADLAELLRERFAEAIACRQLTLIEGDVLARSKALNPDVVAAIDGRSFRLVANLPYGAGTPVIVQLATSHTPCLGQFVTIQREVAERLRAKPGSRDYGELTVLVAATCDVETIASVPPTCFWPRPKVSSEMVSIRRRAQPLTTDIATLAELCRTLFTKRRKQLGAILGRDRDWPPGIEPTARPETLTPQQFIELMQPGAQR